MFHQDPRRLLVRCDAEPWVLLAITFHAPHSGYRSIEREAWWAETMEILQHSYDDDPLFILADANAEPGEYDGETVQSVDSQPLRIHLHFVRCCNPMACTCQLQAPPIEAQMHWSHCNGLSQHCLDHIAIPLAWQQRCTHSEVLEAFDMATAHDDHKMAGSATTMERPSS